MSRIPPVERRVGDVSPFRSDRVPNSARGELKKNCVESHFCLDSVLDAS